MTSSIKGEIIKEVKNYINSDINVKAYGLTKMLKWENFRNDIKDQICRVGFFNYDVELTKIEMNDIYEIVIG